jgi:hypothetical protein
MLLRRFVAKIYPRRTSSTLCLVHCQYPDRDLLLFIQPALGRHTAPIMVNTGRRLLWCRSSYAYTLQTQDSGKKMESSDG